MTNDINDNLINNLIDVRFLTEESAQISSNTFYGTPFLEKKAP